MKAVFGSKRKARKIQVDDDDDVENGDSTLTSNSPSTSSTILGRKTLKKSSLRQSLVFDDREQDSNESGAGDVTNKPTIRPSNSTTKKKKPAATRLSFGPGEIISGDAAESLEDDKSFTPKKIAFGRRVIESNALRKSLPFQGLSNRDDDEERPTYSKDYLDELKSATPNAPKSLRGLHPTAEDEDVLDISELEGAMIVDTNEKSSPAIIPGEAEIREKKERRARLAHEQDFISLNDDEGSGRQLSFLPQRNKAESRLVREDEDLGEGFDEFVDDGRISLGKKQEREARRRQRKEMADMIHHAEGTSDEEDDSDAETRAAYEAAQTRAGMDGLHKPGDDADASIMQMPSRITPLPGLSECLERLRTTMMTMEQDMERRHKNMAELEKEKNEILAREVEVQELLKHAGARYAALKAGPNEEIPTEHRTILEAHNGLTDCVFADRGLDSFGNTPTIRPEVEEDG